MKLFAPVVRAADMDRIHRPVDFVGVNHYSRYVAKRTLLPFYGFRFVKPVYERVLFTDFPWEVYPQGMTETLQWVRDTYGNPPVYVTENGAAFEDVPADGRINDVRRIAYLASYLQSAIAARESGCNVGGFFVWSLLDNFEWAYGYTKRFGLVHVDFETLTRTMKESGRWYASLLAGRTDRARDAAAQTPRN
jgi:beta-glucosidase